MTAETKAISMIDLNDCSTTSRTLAELDVQLAREPVFAHLIA